MPGFLKKKEYIPPVEEKNYVGINNDLIEQEILKRVAFKMSEFKTSLRNIKGHLTSIHSPAELHDKKENAYLAKAIGIVEERLDKETNMGGIYDGLFYRQLVEDKNKLVDEISNVVLKRGTSDYPEKSSRINNLIEQHIYKNNI